MKDVKNQLKRMDIVLNIYQSKGKDFKKLKSLKAAPQETLKAAPQETLKAAPQETLKIKWSESASITGYYFTRRGVIYDCSDCWIANNPL